MKRFCKLALASLLLLTGCAGSGLLASEPMGKQLERALEEIKKDCIARGAPPFGPGSTQYSDTSCLMFTLKPWEPGDTPESVFAHSIKLPPPHDKPKDVYKPGMSSEEYFSALCKEEAGEWVFRRASGVRGLTQDRAASNTSRGYVPLIFYTLEKGEHNNSTPQDSLIQPTLGKYEFVEVRASARQPVTNAGKYLVYFRVPENQSTKKFVTAANGRFIEVPYIVGSRTSDSSDTNYAFTSRGIRRTLDRENAVDGYELILFQKSPFEILALRRTYFHYYLDATHADKKLPSSRSCPNSPVGPYQFIQQVFQSVSN